MLAEHVGAWQDASGAVSTAVCRRGIFIADTLRPETWGAFDHAYGSRAAWQADLATAEEIL